MSEAMLPPSYGERVQHRRSGEVAVVTGRKGLFPNTYEVARSDGAMLVWEGLDIDRERPKYNCDHFFLRYVFKHKEALVRSCGFRRMYAESGETELWVGPELWCFKGPLEGVPNERVERWLLNNGVAGQIFVAKMWGACNPD